MGLMIQENIQDYWSTDEVLSTPFFPQIMSRDKFMNILTFFHLCDNDNYVPLGQEGYNPVHKPGTIQCCHWEFFKCLEAKQKYSHR